MHDVHCLGSKSTSVEILDMEMVVPAVIGGQ